MSSPTRHFPTVCQVCGVSFLAWHDHQKFCSVECSGKAHTGTGHPRWKGDTKSHGYVYISVDGKRIRENRLVAERALGKPLPEGCKVHHWDENKENNDPSNLVICENDAYHMLLHARKRRLDDTGSFDLKRCLTCNEIKPLTAFHKRRRAWDGANEICIACALVKASNYRNKTKQSYV